MQLLLRGGADPRGLPDEDRGRPLFLAVGRRNLVDQLLAGGARFEDVRTDPPKAPCGETVMVPSFQQFGFFRREIKVSLGLAAWPGPEVQ